MSHVIVLSQMQFSISVNFYLFYLGFGFVILFNNSYICIVYHAIQIKITIINYMFCKTWLLCHLYQMQVYSIWHMSEVLYHILTIGIITSSNMYYEHLLHFWHITNSDGQKMHTFLKQKFCSICQYQRVLEVYSNT